jgi:hypothetical protein
MSTNTPDQNEPLVWKQEPAASDGYKQFKKILESRYAEWVEAPKFVTSGGYESWQADLAIQQMMPDEYARALFTACIHGDIKLAKDLWKKNGPFDITYQVGANGQHLINGQPVVDTTGAGHYLTNLNSAGQISELIEWLPGIGMGFMVGVDSDHALLLQTAKVKAPIEHLVWQDEGFAGELPTLSNGLVSSPELLIVMGEKVGESVLPGGYQDVLCWVSKEHLEEFSGSVDPYDSCQFLQVKKVVPGRGQVLRDIELIDVTEEALADVSHHRIEDGYHSQSNAEWDYNGLTLQTFPENYKEPRNSLVLGHFANEAIKQGFWGKPGHTLCRVGVGFLNQFPCGPVDQANLDIAKGFAKNHCPLDIMTTIAKGSGKRTALHRVSGARYSPRHTHISKFFKSFGDDSPLQPHFKQSVPMALFNYMKQEFCDVSFNADVILAVHQGLGLDNSGFAMNLGAKGLQKLVDAGFRFSDDTVCMPVYSKGPSGEYLNHRREDTDTFVKFDPEKELELDSDILEGDDRRAMDDLYKHTAAANLWPGDMKGPTSLSDAMTRAFRKKTYSVQREALLGYIQLAGIDACAAEAKTPAHWALLKERFTRAQIDPYLKVMPREIRGKVIEDDLGL